MKTETTPTYEVRIYVSGPIEIAKQAIREDVLRVGLCVTIAPTTFVYTGGEEVGFVIGLVNYPRFPADPKDIEGRARKLMLKVLDATHQHSALMVTPTFSEWVTKRDE